MSRITSVASGLLIVVLFFGTAGTSPGEDQPDVSPGLLPVGSRAIALPIEIDRAAPAIKPGTRVDVSARDEGRYKGEVVVRDALVLKVRDGERPGERRLLFQVSPLQASVLDLLQKRGKLGIAPREQASEKLR